MEALFLKLARQATAGPTAPCAACACSTRPSWTARSGRSRSAACCRPRWSKLRCQGRRIGDSERLVVTVLLSDIRGFSTIAEGADPTRLAAQLSEHRAEMCTPISDAGGTVMAFLGDAVMAVFGAPFPQPDHAGRALEAARVLPPPGRLNRRWQAAGPPFPLGHRAVHKEWPRRCSAPRSGSSTP